MFAKVAELGTKLSCTNAAPVATTKQNCASFQNIVFEALVPTKHKLGLFVDMKAVSKANKTSYFIKPLKQYLVSPKFSSSTKYQSQNINLHTFNHALSF